MKLKKYLADKMISILSDWGYDWENLEEPDWVRYPNGRPEPEPRLTKEELDEMAKTSPVSAMMIRDSYRIMDETMDRLSKPRDWGIFEPGIFGEGPTAHLFPVNSKGAESGWTDHSTTDERNKPE